MMLIRAGGSINDDEIKMLGEGTRLVLI